MIIDDTLVSIDGEAIAAITGKAVPLTSLTRPGTNHAPIPMTVLVLGKPAGGTSVTLKLQQAEAEGGTFADVPGSTITVAVADIRPGLNMGWRYLPAAVDKPWIRVVVTPTGTFTAGRIFAAVLGEDEMPMREGMYASAGRIVG